MAARFRLYVIFYCIYYFTRYHVCGVTVPDRKDFVLDRRKRRNEQ